MGGSDSPKMWEIVVNYRWKLQLMDIDGAVKYSWKLLSGVPKGKDGRGVERQKGQPPPLPSPGIGRLLHNRRLAFLQPLRLRKLQIRLLVVLCCEAEQGILKHRHRAGRIGSTSRLGAIGPAAMAEQGDDTAAKPHIPQTQGTGEQGNQVLV